VKYPSSLIAAAERTERQLLGAQPVPLDQLPSAIDGSSSVSGDVQLRLNSCRQRGAEIGYNSTELVQEMLQDDPSIHLFSTPRDARRSLR